MQDGECPVTAGIKAAAGVADTGWVSWTVVCGVRLASGLGPSSRDHRVPLAPDAILPVDIWNSACLNILQEGGRAEACGNVSIREMLGASGEQGTIALGPRPSELAQPLAQPWYLMKCLLDKRKRLRPHEYSLGSRTQCMVTEGTLVTVSSLRAGLVMAMQLWAQSCLWVGSVNMAYIVCLTLS